MAVLAECMPTKRPFLDARTGFLHRIGLCIPGCATFRSVIGPFRFCHARRLAYSVFECPCLALSESSELLVDNCQREIYVAKEHRNIEATY
eukprot:6175651-Pleurochrysis_carterae.AAC.1